LPSSRRSRWAHDRTFGATISEKSVVIRACGGARTILADVSDPELVRHILHDLGLPADPPHVARARDPTYDDAA